MRCSKLNAGRHKAGKDVVDEVGCRLVERFSVSPELAGYIGLAGGSLTNGGLSA